MTEQNILEYIHQYNNGTKIFLDKLHFKNTIDIHSQAAYVAYTCFCRKHNLTPDI